MAFQPNYYTTLEACSCPDYQYRLRERKENGGCKHMRALREALEHVAAQRSFNWQKDRERRQHDDETE